MSGGSVFQICLLSVLMSFGGIQVLNSWLPAEPDRDSTIAVFSGSGPKATPDTQLTSTRTPASEARTNLPSHDRPAGSEGDHPAVARVSTESAITAIAVTPDGKYFVTGSQSGLHVYRASSLQYVCRLVTQLQAIHDLKFTGDGSQLAVAGGTPGQFGMLELLAWDHSQQPIQTSLLISTSLHSDVIYAVDWYALPQQLQPSHQLPQSLLPGDLLPGDSTDPGQPESSVVLSNSAWWLATASLDGLSHVFQVPKAPSAVAAVFEDQPFASLTGHSRGLTGVAFVASGTEVSLVTASLDHTLRVWSLPDGKLQRTLNNHTAPVTGVIQPVRQKSGTLPFIASFSDDRTLRFWQPTIGRMVSFRRFTTAPTSAAWLASQDQLIIGCRDGTIHQVTPSTLAVASALSECRDRIHAMAADPQGRFCLAGSRAGVASFPLPATFDASGILEGIGNPE